MRLPFRTVVSRRLTLAATLMAVVGNHGACGKSEPPAAPTPVTTTTNAPAEPASKAPEPAAPTEPSGAPPTPATTDETVTTIAVPPRKRPVVDEKRQGRFLLDWRPPKERRLREVARTLTEAKVFPDLVGALNETFLLPRDITIRFENCDDINAFYDPEKRRISMCWELIDDIRKNFRNDSDDAAEAFTGMLNATLFTFFHELGHALVDVLDLPITGREEDVVDQLATWIALSEGGEDGIRMALDGATSFLHDAEAEKESDEASVTWGEHGLSEQRFYNILCWIYGHKPELMKELRAENDGPLPDERADQCPDEWARLDKAWEKLLGEHVTPDP